MSKKIIRGISLILIPVLFVSFILTGYYKYLSGKIDSQYNDAIGRTYDLSVKDKGIKLLQHSANKNDIIILGSSELSFDLPQSPKNIFPNTQANFNVNLVGRPYVQTLLNAIKVGALSDSLKGKKIVFIVSLQWFMGDPTGITGYKANFSENQFYKMMKNKNIGKDVKKYVCKRTTELLKDESSFERPYLYACLYKNNDVISNIALNFLKPYYYVRDKYLNLKDEYDAYKVVKKNKDEPIKEAADINWAEEEVKAQETGKVNCTNNDFNVLDEYYTKYVEQQIGDLKDSKSDVDLLSSNEFDDYKAFLEVCKETGVKPYIIFMSTNGLYYDYIGLSKEKRIAYYDKIEEMTSSYGFDYLDLRDKEYEPYFYIDFMHLGWRGWLYVSKRITEYYS